MQHHAKTSYHEDSWSSAQSDKSANGLPSLHSRNLLFYNTRLGCRQTQCGGTAAGATTSEAATMLAAKTTVGTTAHTTTNTTAKVAASMTSNTTPTAPPNQPYITTQSRWRRN